MTVTMNISLPEDMREFVERQMAERGFGTGSEFVRDLIRKEQERQELRSMLLQGAAAPRVAEASAPYFAQLRSRAGGRGRANAAPAAKAARKRAAR